MSSRTDIANGHGIHKTRHTHTHVDVERVETAISQKQKYALPLCCCCSLFWLTVAVVFASIFGWAYVSWQDSNTTPKSTSKSIVDNISGFGICDKDTNTIVVQMAWEWTQHPTPLRIGPVPVLDYKRFTGRNSIVYAELEGIVAFNVLSIDVNGSEITATNVTAPSGIPTTLPNGDCHFTLDSVPLVPDTSTARACCSKGCEGGATAPNYDLALGMVLTTASFTQIGDTICYQESHGDPCSTTLPGCIEAGNSAADCKSIVYHCASSDISYRDCADWFPGQYGTSLLYTCNS